MSRASFPMRDMRKHGTAVSECVITLHGWFGYSGRTAIGRGEAGSKLEASGKQMGIPLHHPHWYSAATGTKCCPLESICALTQRRHAPLAARPAPAALLQRSRSSLA